MQVQNLPVLCGEPTYSTPNGLFPFDPNDTLERQFDGRSDHIEIVQRLAKSSPALPAIGLENLIGRDAVHPTAKAALKTERRQMKPGFEQNLLHEVVRFCCVPQHGTDMILQGTEVAVYQNREALSFPRHGAAD